MANTKKWTMLPLAIGSTSTTVAEIERSIGQAANRKVEQGDLVSRRDVHGTRHKRAFCVFECPIADDEEPQQHLEWLSRFVLEHRESLVALSDRCDYDARLSFASEGQGC